MTAVNRSKFPLRAYAIFEPCGRLALRSGELPIFWLKKAAKDTLNEVFDGDGYVDSVAITPISTKK